MMTFKFHKPVNCPAQRLLPAATCSLSPPTRTASGNSSMQQRSMPEEQKLPNKWREPKTNYPTP
jgi:hypothetical protein